MSAAKTIHGSCHCGDVQYQVKLTFPPVNSFDAESIRLYKCNCSTCHKMGFFHCRPISPTDDFILTSPSSIEELGDYRVFSKKIGWYFCKNCGVRILGLGGKWEQADLDIGEWAGQEPDGKTQKVSVTKPDGVWLKNVNGEKVPIPMHYLSVNAVTLDGGEDGVDLREWHEKKWVYYVESRVRERGFSSEMSSGPHPCGMY
jgi:hypothetical protein